MHFKYQSFIESIPECPPTKRVSGTFPAYRFVYADINNPQNFLPPCVKKPNRQNVKGDAARCGGFGLSFYDTLENARASYAELKGRMSSNIYKAIGTHIARGQICEDDGVITEKTSTGHFELHEYAHADFSRRFIIEDKAI